MIIKIKKDKANNEKGEKSMIKEVKNLKLFRKESKEIDENLDQIILGQIDDLQYALDTNAGLKEEDAKALSILMNTRNESKKAYSERVKTIAQIFGITISGAVALVGMVYTVKGYNFDCEWMKKIWDNKDSVNVIDNPSRTNLAKRRDNTRKAVEHLRSMKMDIR